MVGLCIVPYKRENNLQDGPGTHSLSGCIPYPFENIMIMSPKVEEGLSLFLSKKFIRHELWLLNKQCTLVP
jgi:hypothetical protein